MVTYVPLELLLAGIYIKESIPLDNKYPRMIPGSLGKQQEDTVGTYCNYMQIISNHLFHTTNIQAIGALFLSAEVDGATTIEYALQDMRTNMY